MFYGFVITEAGNQLLAKMVAGQTLKLSGVFMDLGTVEDKETARQLIAPLEPGPAGTSTVPTVKGNQVGMIVQFRSDLDGGLKEDKWIGGFGVYAEDPDTGDPVMIYYASLGHQRQPIAAYVEGFLSSLPSSFVSELLLPAAYAIRSAQGWQSPTGPTGVARRIPASVAMAARASAGPYPPPARISR